MPRELETTLSHLKQPEFKREAEHRGYAYIQLISYLAICEQICGVYNEDLADLVNQSPLLPNQQKTLLFLAMIVRCDQKGVQNTCENVPPLDPSIEIYIDDSVRDWSPRFPQTLQWIPLNKFILYQQYCQASPAENAVQTLVPR